jgi:hypothetical protein
MIITESMIACRWFIQQLYKGHAVGGYLHIVTDDKNVEDDNLIFCMGEIEENAERHSMTLLIIQRVIVELLMKMSLAEREYVVRWKITN